MSKDHFYFSRNDRIVALVLLAVIIIAKCMVVIWPAEGTPVDAEADSLLLAPKKVEKPRARYTKDTIRRDTVYIVRNNVRARRQTSSDTAGMKDTTLSLPRYQPKRAPLAALDLNTADSMDLISLPGIGPYFAKRIIRYRDQLGGFYSTSQLAEIDNLPDSVMKWFIITDTVPIRKIQINTMSLSELRNHPYIDFYQARAIVELRRERGKIKGPGQLSFMEEFTAQDLLRLEYYLDFR